MTDPLLVRAREIGFRVWKERALPWREENGLDIPVAWVNSVRFGFEHGDYDREDAVKGALIALQEANDAGPPS